MTDAWKSKAKNISKVILMFGALAAAFLAIKEFGELFLSNKPEGYDDDFIPLVYEDVGDFRSFLQRNNGKRVKINSSIALDIALPINHLVHQTCQMEAPEHFNSTTKSTFYSFGLPEFSKDFESSYLDHAAYIKGSDSFKFSPQILDMVKCNDTLRIELIDPASFRWSYGGTGTQSLPLSGTFKVTLRAYSGPKVEYTLRQVEE